MANPRASVGHRNRIRLLPAVEALEERRLLAVEPVLSRIANLRAAFEHFDPFQNLEALKKKKLPKPTITAMATTPNASGLVTITGKTFGRAMVKLDVGADGRIDQKFKATVKGKFHFTFTVPYGTTPVKITQTSPDTRRLLPP